MASSRPRPLVVEVDGEAHPYRAVDVTIMNCGLLGKLLHPGGPEIRIDDGQLGVWILSLRGIWDYSRYAIGVITGWNVIPKAHFLRAAHTVSIRSRDALPVQADGDMIGSTPIEAKMLPGALTVWCP
jgi:diacylglycerol kinase family enzyme